MINKKLIDPKSIVVVGGSDNLASPGGKVLKNVIDGGFKGELYAINLKQDSVQGVKAYKNPADLPQVDLAIIAIAAKFVPQTVEILAKEKKTGGFIILSAGFSEENHDGAILEEKVVKTLDETGASLIGPNCVGYLNTNYNGVFTTPIPKLNPKGVDFISGSGATAVFIMESGVPNGLEFASVWSVGNSAQLGVEEVLEYLDETFDAESSSKVKLLYIENIDKPEKLLKHASSLIRKGCRIAAIKSGSSSAGSRAASSHTGALATSDVAVDALFRKAGIVRCYSREELTTMGAVFMHKELTGKNIAIITHAGGPAVMLTDSLSNGGFEVPAINHPKKGELLTKLFPGSSVNNPIDFLATGTAEQLGTIIDYCENEFEEIDAMVVIFGSPGLFDVYEVYDLLNDKMKFCKKPIYPVLPSVINAKDEIQAFLAHGRINFPDEVVLGNALTKAYYTPKPMDNNAVMPDINEKEIRAIVDGAENGYLMPEKVSELLDAAGISRVHEATVKTKEQALAQAKELGFPLVMKVVGPVHKSDVGGVTLNIADMETIESEFERMMQIPDAVGVLLQQMISGTELFIGAKKEDKFGHIVMAGLGGIYIEVLKDVQSGIAPIDTNEAMYMIENLKSKKILDGVRGQAGIDKNRFAEIISRVSALVKAAPEISEMDINPLLAKGDKIIAVDARIRIEK